MTYLIENFSQPTQCHVVCGGFPFNILILTQKCQFTLNVMKRLKKCLSSHLKNVFLLGFMVILINNYYLNQNFSLVHAQRCQYYQNISTDLFLDL